MYKLLMKLLIIGMAFYLSITLSKHSSSITEAITYVNNNMVLMALILLAYSLLLAIPYIPSAEIAFCLLLVLGIESAYVVYLSTIFGLFLPYCFGRYWSEKHDTQIEGVIAGSRFLKRVNTMSPILSLILLLNMPGNTILGGGGGIAAVYGSFKIISPLEYLLSISIAALPIFLVSHLSTILTIFF